MPLIDADGHLEESPATFADDYFDPNYRPQRAKVVNVDGMIYWMLEEQLFPRRLGKGCHNLGTPATFNGQPSPHAKKKVDTIPSMELSDINERLRLMDEEEIAVQVVYPTLFLAYPLTANVGLMNALCSLTTDSWETASANMSASNGPQLRIWTTCPPQPKKFTKPRSSALPP